MFQSDTETQASRTLSRAARSGGTWLVHMGIFASLVVLSARMPKESAPEKPAEKDEPARDNAALDLPPVDYDPRCPGPFDEDLRPYSAGMVPPVFISGEKLQHTPEALAARVQGLIIARCTLTCEGEVRNCRILKSLPHMDQAALKMLKSRRYHPVRYQGRPITVSYNFNIRVPPP
ncbi:energy transducer TonB [Hyalangium sp.]|uniref:energy transducer TonB n=1 Tax=Hyalangium sp. TaxID=2028555 RepID=UPI002D28C049|nr:energy transducer TonB [Hyalangium sp.]HYI01147.1 energy transducer TonB [Hyalangium sp.]